MNRKDNGAYELVRLCQNGTKISLMSDGKVWSKSSSEWKYTDQWKSGSKKEFIKLFVDNGWSKM